MVRWSHAVSGLFKLVFEDKLDQLSVEHPYFLERCVAVILRSAVLLVHSQGAPSDSRTFPVAASESVWLSLRLMRGLAGEVVSNLSGRIGLGVLTLVR